MISAETRGYFARFLSVGGVGFLADAAVFQVLVWLGQGPIPARIASTVVAVTVTWYLNRRLTFKTAGVNRRSTEYLRYWLVASVGLVINFGAFLLVLAFVPLAQDIPILALLAGAGAAVLFNFVGARYWAYQREAQGS